MSSNLYPAKSYKLHFIAASVLAILMAIVPFLFYKKQLKEKDKVENLSKRNLEFAKQFVAMETANIVSGFIAKEKKYEMAEKAAIWKPRIDTALLIVATMQNLLTASLDKKNVPIQERKELMGSLKDAGRKLVETLPENLRKRLPVLALQQLANNNEGNDGMLWDEEVLLRTSDAGWQLVLLNLNLSLLRSGHTLVSFCDEQVEKNSCGYDKFEPLISQNSNAVSPGQTLEIKAGVGAFSTAIKASFLIDGKKIETNDFGYASYKKIVTIKDPGQLLMVVSYKDQNGQQQRRETMITYKVLKP